MNIKQNSLLITIISIISVFFLDQEACIGQLSSYESLGLQDILLVITSQEIALMPVDNIPEILEYQMGVTDQLYRGSGIIYLVNGLYFPVRSSVDGYARLDEPNFKSIIPLDAVERLEISRSEYISLYDGGLIVNIITREGGSEFEGETHFEFSNFGIEPFSMWDVRNPHGYISGTLFDKLSFAFSGELSRSASNVYEFDDITYDTTFVADLSQSDPRYIELQRQMDLDIITNWETVDQLAEATTGQWSGMSGLYRDDEGDFLTYSNRYRVGDMLRTYSSGQWRTAWCAPDPNNDEKLYQWDSWSGWHAFGHNDRHDFGANLTYRINPKMKLSFFGSIYDLDFKTYSRSWQYAMSGRNVHFVSADNENIRWEHEVIPNWNYTFHVSRSYWRERIRVLNNDGKELSREEYSDFDLYNRFYRNGRSDQLWSNESWKTLELRLDSEYHWKEVLALGCGGDIMWNETFAELYQLLFLDNPYHEDYRTTLTERSAYLRFLLSFNDVILEKSQLRFGGGFKYHDAKTGGVTWCEWDNPEAGICEYPRKHRAQPNIMASYSVPYDFRFGQIGWKNIAQIKFTYREFYSEEIQYNLNMEKINSYELGLEQSFNKIITIRANAWKRKITGETGTVYVAGFDPDSLGHYNYSNFVNYDYGKLKGIDISIEGKVNDYFSGILNYTYSKAVANRYYQWTGYWDTQISENGIKNEILMDYDRPHVLHANLTLHSPDNYGLSIGRVKPLENFHLCLLFRIQSGLPYTPHIDSKMGEPNSERGPSQWWLDMKLRRNLKIKGMFLGVYTEVKNLFDRKNESTSISYESPTETSTFLDSPYNDGPRRMIRLGAVIEL